MDKLFGAAKKWFQCRPNKATTDLIDVAKSHECFHVVEEITKTERAAYAELVAELKRVNEELQQRKDRQ